MQQLIQSQETSSRKRNEFAPKFMFLKRVRGCLDKQSSTIDWAFVAIKWPKYEINVGPQRYFESTRWFFQAECGPKNIKSSWLADKLCFNFAWKPALRWQSGLLFGWIEPE